MADEDYKRRLAVILSADAEGYSLLLAHIEVDIIHTSKSCRIILQNITA